MTGVVERVVTGRVRDVGGHALLRVLPFVHRRHVGPFVFLDHFGPASFGPGQAMSVDAHPHIGLSTVTYLLAGEILHRDSLGTAQVIRPGELNLMTAGSGVVHVERPTPRTWAEGGTSHGLQLWLAQGPATEDGPARFQHAGVDALPTVRGAGWHARVLLGRAWGVASPVHVDPRDPQPVLADVTLDDGATLDLPDAADLAVYVVEGTVRLDDTAVGPLALAVLTPGRRAPLVADGPARVAVLGGEALDAPRVMDWNFVATTRERIEAAKARWRAGGFDDVPGDDGPRIPYPGDDQRPS